jgi:hypothetical protein
MIISAMELTMRLRLLAGCVSVLFVAGCGGGDEFELIDVSGTANFMGHPIEDGSVRFVPKADSGGTSQPARTAQIISGKYSATGRAGIAPGEYILQVEAYTKNPGASADPAQEGGEIPEAMIRSDQVLPEKFNKKSDMTLTIESGSDPIEQNFDLKE